MDDADLECPICYTIFENPVELYPCNHNICQVCINRLIDLPSDEPRPCPMCRCPIQSVQTNITLDNIIKTNYRDKYLSSLREKKIHEYCLNIRQMDPDIDFEEQNQIIDMFLGTIDSYYASSKHEFPKFNEVLASKFIIVIATAHQSATSCNDWSFHMIAHAPRSKLATQFRIWGQRIFH